METLEPVETINARLVDYFGAVWDGRPAYRIIFANNELEKRFGEFEDWSPAGIFIRTYVGWREVPKYKQWASDKYILEQLVAVPDGDESLGLKTSYEPLFIFEDKQGFPLPPKWEAAKFVIDTMLAAKGESSMYAKYVDPDIDNPQEKRDARITKLTEELFGNETNAGDALAYKEGIVVPSNYNTNDIKKEKS